MKGYVLTPPLVVDRMISNLFRRRVVSPETTVLDAGCAGGAFIEGILRWCGARHVKPPRVVGVELNPQRVEEARARFARHTSVSIERGDFLRWNGPKFDFVVGNPPYVPITQLSDEEKSAYRALYSTAKGRFDLYILFFEKAVETLKPNGRLVFVTPEKFLYVDTAAPLRRLLAAMRVEEIDLVPEDTFGELVTYPTITTLANRRGGSETTVILRSRKRRRIRLPLDGSSWQPFIQNGRDPRTSRALADACDRISCGVATGADSVFVVRDEELDSRLRPFAHPTLAGRELTPTVTKPRSASSMLIPYAHDGHLLGEAELGTFIDYLSDPGRKARLLSRTCVARKPWYAFHENPPLADLLRPKILCKDITARPQFWIDWEGTIVPRHSVYYVVPRDPLQIADLAAYLNSKRARRWLEAHCQRAANGFFRVQSRVLKRLPLPDELVNASGTMHPHPQAALRQGLGVAK